MQILGINIIQYFFRKSQILCPSIFRLLNCLWLFFPLREPLVLPKNCVIIYIDFIEFTPQFHIIFD